MKRLTVILLVFMAIYGCREPFEFDFEEIDDPKVVIEGFISDRGSQHAIKVSYTATLDDFGVVDTQFIEDANVRIEDDLGGSTLLRHREAGVYLTSTQYRAQEGRTYTLVVTLANGDVYQSVPRTLPPASPATAQLEVTGATRLVLANNNLVEEEGASVTVTIDKDNERHYYQWLIGHYYIFEADKAIEEENRLCYVRDFDKARILLLQDNAIGAGEADQYSYEIDFIPIGKRMRHEFGVEGRLLTMNEDDYIFWEEVKSLAENTGGLFDAAPFTLEGNISNRSTGELALGYFGVYRESMEREFFTQLDLGFNLREFPDCELPPWPYQMPIPCEDCRVAARQENYGIVRPSWWR